MRWISETKHTLEVFKAKEEPMSYVLPTTEITKCFVCEAVIKKGTEVIHEFDGQNSHPVCRDECWIEYWKRKWYN